MSRFQREKEVVYWLDFIVLSASLGV